MVFVTAVIFLICFVLIRALPLRPISESATPEQKALIILNRQRMGWTDEKGNKLPIFQQLGPYLKQIFTEWRWGESEVSYKGYDATEVVGEKLPNTMYVNLLSIILSIPIGILLGIYAALKKNTWIDHLISTGVMIFISVPSFVYAFLVQNLFCYQWKIFESPLMDLSVPLLSWKCFVSVIMPIIALSFGTVAGFTRVTRAELTEVLTSDFMLLARTKGLTKAQAVMRHGMRNCMIIILPAIFGQFIGIMGGSMIIENIFSIPGVGGLYLNSIQNTDYNYFMYISMFYTVIGLLSGIVVDISYGFIDPRVRMGSRK